MSLGIEKPLAFACGTDVIIDWTHADGVDITGMTWSFDIMPDYDEPPLVTKTSGAGITQTSTTTLRITLTSANLALAAGNRVYTLSRTDSGAKDVYSFGPITLGPPRVSGT